MKLKIVKILCLLATLCLSGQVWAQKPVQIKGQLEEAKGISSIKLFKVVNGKPKEIANAIPQGDNKFGFQFFPDYEGLFLIGFGNEGSPGGNFKFYFKGGDKLDFIIRVDPDITYDLVGTENTKENEILAKWHKLVLPIENKSINFHRTISNYVDYFPQQEEIVAKAEGFLKEHSLGASAHFNALLGDIVQLDLATYATNFLNTPRTAHPDVSQYAPFYTALKNSNLAEHAYKIFAYPYGMRTLNGFLSMSKRMDADGTNTPMSHDLAVDFRYVANDTLRGELLLDRLASAKSYEDYDALMREHKVNLVNKSQQDRSMAIMIPLLDLKAGSSSYQFSFPDTKGEIVSMGDLKGKVVLIDVWATWCGPCRAQFPHLRELKAEFEGTDLQVVGISVDEGKDLDKWKQMVIDESLGGIQLFANGWSEITKYYKITGIPRFMVFDKQGKIVDVNAPRPSDPKLRELLKAELAK